MGVLAVRDLVVGRGEKKLLGPLTFNVGSGSVLWLRGSNGIGKTTLLKTLSTTLSPLGGSVFWNHRKLSQYDKDYLLDTVYLGHALALHSLLSPLEYLRLSLIQARGLLSDKRGTPQECLQEVLAQAGLASLQHKACGVLSRGQQQRLALARCLLQSGSCWIMDEPLSGLDPIGQQWAMELISNHIQQGGMAVIVSHSPLSLTHAQIQTLYL
jgi:heme exporter protein A